MNCVDNECKYILSTYEGDYCTFTGTEVPDEIAECDHFVQAHTCLNCKHSKLTIYETGTIDDIEYRCPFQNNKLIYDDLNAYNTHFADVPECNINRWEEI